MRPFERTHAGSLNEILRVVPITGNAKRERPKSRQHLGKHAW
ncbi:hypothetical protein BSU04_38285 [Caballeronia sordidicola]|uniref:Uncharacterized protein n=1 Tax=Caballeronia sordidicola TaxID=196367 RepID=A0A226WPT0_CABSO|nr:hypothetical protein BSU04_38285 [Caballeronia sordidicola]